MNNKTIFRFAMTTMIVALAIMAVNSLIFPLNDWIVRIAGVIMMIDLVVLMNSFMRIKRQDT